MTIKEFVTKAITHSIEDIEDEMDVKQLGIARREVANSRPMSWEELEKKLGWDHEIYDSKVLILLINVGHRKEVYL